MQSSRPSRGRFLSTPGPRHRVNGERQPLIRRRSFDNYESGPEEAGSPVPNTGGTVLGIHNLAIVMPQFIVSLPYAFRISLYHLPQVALVTSVIFRIVDGESQVSSGPTTYLGKTGVGWVLRFGGCCALIGALIVRRVPPTPTEKAMRRRLGEMQLLEREDSA